MAFPCCGCAQCYLRAVVVAPWDVRPQAHVLVALGSCGASNSMAFLVELNMMLEESNARMCMFPPLSETDYLQLPEAAAVSRGEARNSGGGVRSRYGYWAM